MKEIIDQLDFIQIKTSTLQRDKQILSYYIFNNYESCYYNVLLTFLQSFPTTEQSLSTVPIYHFP